MTLGVWTRLTQTSLRDSETYVHHPCLSFPCILPVNQEDVSAALTASHHLSLRPPGRKVAGKLDKNRSPCLTSMLPLEGSPRLALMWSLLLPTFLWWTGHPLLTSLAPSTTPMLLLPHPGHVPSQVTGKPLKCPLHMVCFEQVVWSHQREISFS